MKNSIKLINKFFLSLLVMVIAFAMVSCGKEEPKPAPTPFDAITVELFQSKDVVELNGSVEYSAKISGTNASSCTWSLDSNNKDLVTISGNILTVTGTTMIDKNVVVTVTVTLNGEEVAKASKSLLVKAPIVAGQVGELTSEMIQKYSNPSVTVTGTVTDYYYDLNQPLYNTTHEYDMTVEMADGAWNGRWNVKGEDIVVEDVYRRGEKDGVKDDYGNVGHALEKVYIDKNNEVAKSVVKNYLSIPSVWEAQHLWNHLGSLNVNKFSYDAVNEVYKYNYDKTNEDELYLLTYLSYSLTPMLEDTLDELYFKVSNGEITEILAQTEKLYYGADTQEDADAYSYTVIRVTLSKLGTTVPSSATPYAAPEHADKLAKAIDTMQKATNYTYMLTDTTTSAPSSDAGEYEISTNVSTTSATRLRKSVINHTSATGKVGDIGQITDDYALFAKTGQYSYTMDGNSYHTTYTGYRKMSDTIYDEFACNNAGLLYGTRRHQGDFHDALPQFDFSANVFQFAGSETRANGLVLYKFTLNSSAITRDIAMEISNYSYADDATASVRGKLTLVVDGNGNFVSSEYPYSIVGGTYMGVCTTQYSRVGTTTLDETTLSQLSDANYVPREEKTQWSQYAVNDFKPELSTLVVPTPATAEDVLRFIYGDSYSDVPSPNVLLNIFGDYLSGPFFNWRDVTIGDEAVKYPYMSITTQSQEYDENVKITNYAEIVKEFKEALEKEGFTLSLGNSNYTQDDVKGDRVITMIKGDVLIVLENNNTKWFWIKFYRTGEWTLNR